MRDMKPEELAAMVSEHDHDIAELKPTVRRHGEHIKNCVDSRMVHEEAVRQLTEMRTDVRSDFAGITSSATAILDAGLKRILEDFGDDLSVCKDIKANQEAQLKAQAELAQKKIERDERIEKRVKRATGIIGMLVAAVELYRALRP